MQAAIIVLQSALDTMETNEPINRAEGNVEQADLEAGNIVIYQQALAILRAT